MPTSASHHDRTRHAPVSPTAAAAKTLEKRCRQWCRGARIGAIQFSSYCHSFPLFALLEPGDRATDTGQYRGPETQRNPEDSRGFVEKHCVLKRSAEAERQGFEPWVPVRALRFSRLVQLHKNRCVVRDDYLKNSLCGGYFRCVPTQPAHLKASRGPHGGMVQLDSSGA